MFNNAVSKEFVTKDSKVIKLTITKLPASKGAPLVQKLAGLIGGMFTSDNASLVAAIISVADKIDIYETAKTLFSGALINCEETSFEDFPLNPDTFFSGNYGLLIDFAAFALEENFGSFFDSKTLAFKIPA